MVIITLAVVFTGWSLLRQRESNPFNTDLAVVCVESGEILYLDRTEVSMYPAKNPDTGRKTLLPFSVRGENKYIARRYKNIVASLDEKEVNKYVDVKTLEIRE
ncbi:MAG: hypothetical protein ACYTHJ_08115 [Planctomycetota bacterium]